MSNNWDRIQELFSQPAVGKFRDAAADTIQLVVRLREVVEDLLVPGTSHYSLTLTKSGVRSPYSPGVGIRSLGNGYYAIDSNNIVGKEIAIESASLEEVIRIVKSVAGDIKEDDFYLRFLDSK